MATEIIQAGARLDITTLNALIRKVVDPVYRKDYFLSEIMKRGRLSKRQGGKRFEWKVRFRRREPVVGQGYPEAMDYQSTNYWQEASLPYRELQMGERIDAMEILAQQSGGSDVQPVAVINLVEGVTKNLAKDFTAFIAQEVWGDGNAGASDHIHGMESIFSYSGSVTNSPVGNPNDSYAGLSATLGNYGGSWTPGTGYGWPHGVGEAEYGFFSPLIVDYNSTLLTASDTADTSNWRYQWESALRYATTYGQLLQNVKYDALVLDPEMLRIARDSLTDRTRFVATSVPTNVSIGWSEYDFEGLKIVDQALPAASADCGYFLSFEHLELRSMLGQLVETKKDYDLDTNADKIALRAFLNLKIESPAYFAKLAAISTAGT